MKAGLLFLALAACCGVDESHINSDILKSKPKEPQSRNDREAKILAAQNKRIMRAQKMMKLG